MFAKAYQSLLVLAIALLLTAGAAEPARACTTDEDCADGLYCNGAETCVGGVCDPGTNPCLPGETCDEVEDECTCTQDDDCDDSNPCTDDMCPANTCVYTYNEDSCSDGNPCTEDDQCNYGYCVGLFVSGCCVTGDDCDDFKDCTEDVCAAGTCTNTSLPVGTACGNDTDDACTDPDTCDGAGACLPNHAANGTSCPAGECTAGMCDPRTYSATVLPEGPFIASVPHDMACIGGGQNAIAYTVGYGVAPDEIRHPLVWDSIDGETWTRTQLSVPGPDCSDGEALTVDCNTDTGTCVAGGFKCLPGSAQPLAWRKENGGPWTPELPLLPAGSTGGQLIDMLNDAEEVAVGYTVDGDGFHHATLWIRDEFGTWTVSLLPDFEEGRKSAATSVAVYPADAPPELCEEGTLLIGGSMEDEFAVEHPAVWITMGAG